MPRVEINLQVVEEEVPAAGDGEENGDDGAELAEGGLEIDGIEWRIVIEEQGEDDEEVESEADDEYETEEEEEEEETL